MKDKVFNKTEKLKQEKEIPINDKKQTKETNEKAWKDDKIEVSKEAKEDKSSTKQDALQTCC